ncbi:hypothetical protein AAC387_Pa11g0326 [Persea americana]
MRVSSCSISLHLFRRPSRSLALIPSCCGILQRTTLKEIASLSKSGLIVAPLRCRSPQPSSTTLPPPVSSAAPSSERRKKTLRNSDGF